MTPNHRVDQLEMLGIPEILYKNKIPQRVKQSNVRCLILECTKEYSFCQPGETKDLLKKMLSAIDLTLKEVTCLNVESNEIDSVIKQNPSQSVLIMGQSISTQKDNVYITHHPKDIMTNTSAKRQVWETLKQLKKCLN